MLTREFVDTVELSKNPIRRHFQVKGLLNDPEMLGEGVRVLVNGVPPQEYINGNRAVIEINTVLPLVGRDALRKTVSVLDTLE
jgi:hypothetical protein